MSQKLCETTVNSINALRRTIAQALQAPQSLEEASQTFVNILFEEFEESIAVIRLFVTIPFGKLPEAIQTSVLRTADVPRQPLANTTPTLMLLGLHEAEEFRNAKHYFGIPLISPATVEAIPMIAQLLQELGFPFKQPLRRAASKQESEEIETSSIGFLSGLFYVPDAQNAVNAKGQRILSVLDQGGIYNHTATDEVETIFGIGGAYVSGPFIATVIFSREPLDRVLVERFMPLANFFKTSTTDLVLNEDFFANRR
jgi:hypothetical protein